MRKEATLKGHNSSVWALALTSNNKYLVSGSIDYTVRIWDLQEKIQVAVLHGHNYIVHCLAITSDNQYIVSCSKNLTVIIWNLTEKQQEAVLKDNSENLVYNWIAVSNDMKYIVIGCGLRYAGDTYYSIKIWRFEDKKLEAALKGHTKHVKTLAITSDSHYAISGSDDNTVIIWNLREKRLEAILQGHKYAVNTVIISRDNKYIVTGSYNSIIIWKIKELIQEISIEYPYCLHSISISNDNEYLVYVSQDQENTMRTLNLKNKREVDCYPGHNECVSCVIITNDKSILSLEPLIIL